MAKQTNGNGGNVLSLVNDKDTLKGILESDNFRESMQAVASKYMTADRVVKVSLLAASRQPKLFQCTAQSFLQSVIKGAELGLEFGGTTQQGFLVPYKNGFLSKKMNRDVYECQFIPGYRGFIELAYRAGNVNFIDVQLVYEKDDFDYGFDYGTGKSPFIHHKPNLRGDRGVLVCGYSVIILTDSPLPKIDFMTAAELEQIHQCSKSKDDGPWVTFPDQMQKKSVIRRSIKWIRTTPELAAAEEADNVDYNLGTISLNTDHELGTEGTKRRLAAAMNKPAVTEAQQAAAELDAHFEGGDQESPTGDAGQASWLCNAGHAFGTPKPSPGTLFGVCPECGSKDIKQLA